MSDTRGDARGASFDEAIDRAVREMLDIEPPAGLRGRVLDLIENRRSPGWSWTWVAAPLAAAAILVLAVLLPSESGRPVVAPPPKVAGDVHLPTVPSAPRAPQTRPPIVVAKTGTRPPRAQQSIAAAMLPADSPFEGARVEALAGPEPIAIDRLAGPPAPSVTDLGVAPIQIRALELNALTETPRERREE
jgi:hypothetical protein